MTDKTHTERRTLDESIEASGYVVARLEPCPRGLDAAGCAEELECCPALTCENCMGDGTRAVLEQAQRVEYMPGIEADEPGVWVPVDTEEP